MMDPEVWHIFSSFVRKFPFSTDLKADNLQTKASTKARQVLVNEGKHKGKASTGKLHPIGTVKSWQDLKAKSNKGFVCSLVPTSIILWQVYTTKPGRCI